MRTFPDILGQHGLATRDQLVAAGWTPDARLHFVRRRGQQPLPGVYLDRRGDLTTDERAAAALLWAGAGALVTGAHALRLLGVEVPSLPEVVLVLVPQGRRSRSHAAAMTVRTKHWPKDRTMRGVRVAALERSLADAGRHRELRRPELRSVTLAVLQRALSTPERILDELASGNRNGTAAVREGVVEFQFGVRSAAEVMLRRELSALGYEFVMNRSLTHEDGALLGYPDAYLTGVGLAIQLHSKRYHSGFDSNGDDLWCATVEHDADFVARGVPVLGVTPATLRGRPGLFRERVTSAVASLQGRPLPPVFVGDPLPGCVAG